MSKTILKRKGIVIKSKLSKSCYLGIKIIVIITDYPPVI